MRENELIVGQEFGNIYEESKACGEMLVRQADFLDCYTIFRPSIIVGDSETGFSTTFHGFYTPLRLLSAIARSFLTTHYFPSITWRIWAPRA